VTGAPPRSPSLDQLVEDLSAVVEGEVRFDAGSIAAYSCDSSIYRQVPMGVVVPRDPEDAVRAIGVCRRHEVPVLSRGGGTSLAGQTTNAAVVLDWSKYCNRVVSVDPAARTCVVEPGIALDDLDRAVGEHDLMFGPRPSTHQSCTLGGMIGNNSCGATAQAYGKTADNVRRLEILTYEGERWWVGPTENGELERILASGGRQATLYRDLVALRDRHLAAIRTGFPQIPRRVSGYNLEALLPEHGLDVARALVGSEGTLVTVLRAELELVPRPAHKVMVLLGFPDIAAAGDAVPSVLEHDPWQLEAMDDVLISLEDAARIEESVIHRLPRAGGWLMVQLAGESEDDVRRAAHRLGDQAQGWDPAPSVEIVDDPVQEGEFIEVREAGLGATAHPSARHETWEGWEDAAVPPDRLGDYLRDFRDLLDEFDFDRGETSLYGHFGQGCVHTRIPFELRTAPGIAHYRAFAERAADLVVDYGGSLSGEHGDGQSRGELLGRMFGPELMTAFGELKAIFDPGNRMNPGKLVDPDPLDSHLRLGTEFAPRELTTWFAYPKDEGKFSKASMRCVGVGKCRQSGSEHGQVMCPSYMVTREEEHSPRGRSRLLFEMVRGETVPDGWHSEEVRDALDLCLACKGCKVDCPVNVDVATYKAEFLAHHYAHRVRPASHYSMGWLPATAAIARRAPRAVDRAAHAPLVGRLLKRAGGVAPERELPHFAPEPFTGWWRSRPRSQAPGERGRVLLWPDTFTNTFHPQAGQAAVAVLEDAGFSVEVPDRTLCCGLTWISTGQLGVARRVLKRTVAAIRDDLRAGTPIVGLEPSCTAVFRSDAGELIPDDEDVRRLSLQTSTLAELLASRAPDWDPPHVGGKAIMQVHCHQHAVLGEDSDLDLLRRAGVDAEELESGCCGLACNFGFEREHYDVSRAAGERVLLPRVREAAPDTAVLADGFSCRTQIEQGDTGRHAVHLAELLARGLDGHRRTTTSTKEER
jgi:FAD/FMN-containing dehydrogenase/Fe-S oxidoreductase